jgi:hypothetical protein
MGDIADWINGDGWGPDEIGYTQGLDINKDYIWTTGEGVDIHISDMSDRHLNNAIRYIERVIKAEFENNYKLYLPNIYYNMCTERDKREISRQNLEHFIETFFKIKLSPCQKQLIKELGIVKRGEETNGIR